MDIPPFIERNVTIAKTNVKSATFEPSKAPNPNSGTPFNAEIIDTVVSGNDEITATIKKLIKNSDKWNVFAIFEAYLLQ